MTTDEVTWLREIEKAMTPGEWVDGAGDIFAVADLKDGMVKDGECEVASCYGRNRQADEAGIVALRNTASAVLGVIEAAERIHGVAAWRKRHAREPGVVYEANADVARLADALDAFCAAVRGEQERE